MTEEQESPLNTHEPNQVLSWHQPDGDIPLAHVRLNGKGFDCGNISPITWALIKANRKNPDFIGELNKMKIEIDFMDDVECTYCEAKHTVVTPHGQVNVGYVCQECLAKKQSEGQDG